MSFDYAKSAATAARLIKRFGQEGAIRRRTQAETGGQPTNPWEHPDDVPGEIPAADVDYPATLVVLEYTLGERENSLIQNSDKKVFISTEGLEVEPTEADQLVVQGRALEIVTLMPLAPAGTVVFYEAQARG